MFNELCPKCGKAMTEFDHDDEDGNFAGWEWFCECGYHSREDE